VIHPGHDDLMNDPFEALLTGYVFQNNTCVHCGCHAALFATPRMFSACPRCLAERIRALKVVRDDLPDWALYLEGAGAGEVRRQTDAEQKALSVTFDDLYQCGACGKFILEREARYSMNPGTASSPPYCVDCYTAGHTERRKA
jgi:hypothetical protein